MIVRSCNLGFYEMPQSTTDLAVSTLKCLAKRGQFKLVVLPRSVITSGSNDNKLPYCYHIMASVCAVMHSREMQI